ncbi:hypothetical protein GGI25_006142 [Coemansia spiralis]|uniref:HMG box domain-containing protein n=2 Tax=Coemansia TaxID=4863 RepID=A0A9W8FXF5_9FUNG|nr:high mobility group box domain-containing protein [Coemansia spiralis]KAJ1989481.1 hypothetical protein EDC05_004667 [Coemansia umbellata]KAJ2620160.1 hypothetical protein GGI26_005225 [Coemansia sp. RSA 1358]KAJ2669442.1 hypothetical protein GGI25_006142 [Coemansia spiralis]
MAPETSSHGAAVITPEDAHELATTYFKLAEVYSRIAGIPHSPSKTEKSTQTHATRRDPDLPKRPMNAYLIYSAEARAVINRKFPDLPPKEVLVKIGQSWKDLTNEQRQKYNDMAKVYKSKYVAEMEKYNDTHLKSKKRKNAPSEYEAEENGGHVYGTGNRGTAASTSETHVPNSDTAIDGTEASQTKKTKKKSHSDEPGVEKKKKKKKIHKTKEDVNGTEETPKKKKTK